MKLIMDKTFGTMEVIFYNCLGHRVKSTLISYNRPVDISDLSSRIYTVEVIVDETKQIQNKLVVLK